MTMVNVETTLKPLQSEDSEVKLNETYDSNSEDHTTTTDTSKSSPISQTPMHIEGSKSLTMHIEATNTETTLVKSDFFRTSYPSLNIIINHVDSVISRIKPVNFEPPSYLDENLLKPDTPPDVIDPRPRIPLHAESQSFFVTLREHLVNFQTSQNIPHEAYNFVSLLTTLCALGCKAIHSVFLIVTALLPMMEILIHILRFLVDRGLAIANTRGRQERFRRWLIFGVEASVVICLVIFVTSSVLLPLGSLSVLILYKILIFFFAM